MGAGSPVPKQSSRQDLPVNATATASTNIPPAEQTVEMPPHLIHTLVDRIWTQYDSNDDGVLDSNEFNILVSETMAAQGHRASSIPTAEEITELLQVVDKDGDGIITKDEFETMMNGLMVMPQDDRDEMAELSPPFGKMVILVESLMARARSIRKKEIEWVDMVRGTWIILRKRDWHKTREWYNAVNSTNLARKVHSTTTTPRKTITADREIETRPPTLPRRGMKVASLAVIGASINGPPLPPRRKVVISGVCAGCGMKRVDQQGNFCSKCGQRF